MCVSLPLQQTVDSIPGICIARFSKRDEQRGRQPHPAGEALVELLSGVSSKHQDQPACLGTVRYLGKKGGGWNTTTTFMPNTLAMRDRGNEKEGEISKPRHLLGLLDCLSALDDAHGRRQHLKSCCLADARAPPCACASIAHVATKKPAGAAPAGAGHRVREHVLQVGQRFQLVEEVVTPGGYVGAPSIVRLGGHGELHLVQSTADGGHQPGFVSQNERDDGITYPGRQGGCRCPSAAFHLGTPSRSLRRRVRSPVTLWTS